MKQIILTHAVIKNNQKILLLRKGTMYQLPGGIVSFGKEPKETIRIAIKEQLGSEPEVIQYFTVASLVSGGVQTFDIIFLASLSGQEKAIHLSSQSTYYKWFSVSE